MMDGKKYKWLVFVYPKPEPESESEPGSLTPGLRRGRGIGRGFSNPPQGGLQMKRLMFVLSLLLILPLIIPASATAIHQEVEEGVLLTRAVILANRTQIVLNTLELNTEQIDAFSPVYLDYWEEMNLINDKLADLILDYSDNFENLSDEKALSLLDGYLDVQKDKVALKKKYVKKFKKVLTPKKLVQYYQTENKLDAIIMMELAAGVPLVE
jgi:hypothetical protein